MATLNIQSTDLAKSAVQYQKEILIMPVIGAYETLKHMTPLPGSRGRVVMGSLGGDIELGPYDPSRVDNSSVSVDARTLEVFLGSVVKKFDPNEAWQTVYGSLLTQGEELKQVDMTQQVLFYLAAQLGKKLNESVFSAKRNDAGTTTKDLFDGFDSITEKEITAGNIATAKKNLYEFGAAFTHQNACDLLKAFYWAASDELQSRPTKMYIPVNVMNAYTEDYQQIVGAVPYNQQYQKTFLEGSNNLCELVPLVSKKGSNYIHLAPQGNMVYGYGNGLAEETIAVEKHAPFLLDFVATMFFGTQFRSIAPEALFVGKLHA